MRTSRNKKEEEEEEEEEEKKKRKTRDALHKCTMLRIALKRRRRRKKKSGKLATRYINAMLRIALKTRWHTSFTQVRNAMRSSSLKSSTRKSSINQFCNQSNTL